MKLNNVTIEQARGFLNARPPEDRKYYDIDVDREIRTAEFITGVWLDGELVGVSGVAHAYRVFHHTFYMVCKKAQGKGCGKQLQKDNFNYIRANKVPLLVQTVMKGNEAALRLHSGGGSKIVYETKDSYHLVRIFTTTGKITAPFVPILLSIFHSPVGQLIQRVKNIPALKM